MKLTDIIELAKQGYKPSDIRELLKIETETAPAAADPDPDPDPAPAAADPDPDPDPAPAEPKQPAEDPDPAEPDYKQLYEEEKAKRQALARKQEVAKDDTKSVEDTLLDIAKMYI